MGGNNELEVGGDELGRIHWKNNRRKRDLFWIGFLEGAQSSGRIEEGEIPALEAEARAFAEFFQDPDARDLAEDILYVHDRNSNDLYEQLTDVIEAKRRRLLEDGEFSDKDWMNEFLGFCAGVICDGKVLEREAIAMAHRFKRDPYLSKHPLLVRLRDTLFQAISDGVLTGDEADDIHAWIVRIVGDGYADTGMASIGTALAFDGMIDDHSAVVFEGMCFVITGALRLAPRREIVAVIESLNGIFSRSITMKTNYVILASTASRDWKATHFGTKIEKAQEYLNQGAQLRFLPEHIFEEALKTRNIRL